MMNFFKIRKKVFCFKSNGLVEYFREKNQKSLWQLVRMKFGKTFVGYLRIYLT